MQVRLSGGLVHHLRGGEIGGEDDLEQVADHFFVGAVPR